MAALDPVGAEFPLAETHGIAHWPTHRLLTDSRGLGWHAGYTSLASESSWSGSLKPVPHYCLALCLHRPAAVSRHINGDRRKDLFELRPHVFGAIVPDHASTWSLRGSPDVQLVYVRRSIVDGLADELFGVMCDPMALLAQVGFIDGMLEQLVLALLNAARDADGGASGLYADHLVHTIALHLLREHSSLTKRTIPMAGAAINPHHIRMRRVRDLIESALGEDLSLERLAREAGVSAHAFSAAFTRAFGVTPHAYVLQRRLELAKRLLRETDLSVTCVAVQTGFASQSHLSLAFKRSAGVTPGVYRHAGRAP